MKAPQGEFLPHNHPANGRRSLVVFELLGALLILAGCSQEPIVRVQYIETKTYIPIPSTLTQPISIDLTGDTWGKAVGDLKAGLEACNGNLSAVAGLKPPP